MHARACTGVDVSGRVRAHAHVRGRTCSRVRTCSCGFMCAGLVCSHVLVVASLLVLDSPLLRSDIRPTLKMSEHFWLTLESCRLAFWGQQQDLQRKPSQLAVATAGVMAGADLLCSEPLRCRPHQQRK